MYLMYVKHDICRMKETNCMASLKLKLLCIKSGPILIGLDGNLFLYLVDFIWSYSVVARQRHTLQVANL